MILKQNKKAETKTELSATRAGTLERLYSIVGALLVLTLLPLAAPTIFGQAPPPPTQPTAEELALKAKLEGITQEIDGIREVLRSLRETRENVEDEIIEIEAEVRRTELSIARSEIALEALQFEIARIQEQVAVYERAVGEHQQTTAEVVRDVAQRDEIPAVAVFFSAASLSDFADELEASARLQEQLLASISGLRDAQSTLTTEQERLEGQHVQQQEARALLVIEREELLIKRELQAQLQRRAELRETETERVLSLTELDAARVRRQLFPLTDTDGGLTFEEAYVLADPIAKAVGIRTAFLLAILQKETHLGELKGTGTWRIDMHPRDWDAFIQITSELGLSPDAVPVSRAPSYGWGGAMGPAQFLPSTWLAYKNSVADITGHRPPSPWNIEDAFAASAVKLARDGAWAQNESAEWKAAMIYFAGGNWSNPAYAFYGDAVEDLTARFAAMIQILEADQNQPEDDTP